MNCYGLQHYCWQLADVVYKTRELCRAGSNPAPWLTPDGIVIRLFKTSVMNKYRAIKVNGRKRDEHRHKVELSVGRSLEFNEVVHHKDGNKANNDLNNLEVLPRSIHSRMHMIGRSHNTNQHMLKHPSISSYEKGCRCEACKVIKNEYMRKWRQNKKGGIVGM